MEKFKKLKITLISVLLALILAVSAAVLVIAGNKKVYAASPYYVDLDGNTVFYTPISTDSIISESEPLPKEGREDGSEDTARYTSFKIGDGQYVAYRQNLAYSWKSSKKEDGKPTPDYEADTFSIKLSFKSLNFKRYIIKFQSQQYVMTKEGKSENYLVFEPDAEAAHFTIKVAQSLEEDENGNIKEYEALGQYEADERVEIEFDENFDTIDGNYGLLAKGDKHDTVYGEAYFKNVYEHYATYVSSGDNAVTPMTFSAEFGENQKSEVAEMILYDISGQSFEMHSRNGGYRVEDTASPVICFSETPSYLEYGKAIGLKYKVIDVLASNPGATAYYYVLTGDQYKNEDDKFDYDRTDYTEEKKEGEESGTETDEEKQTSPFIKVTSSSGIRIIRDDKTFIPVAYKDGVKTDEYDNVCGLVKLYYELYDRGSTSSTSQKDTVFASWYASSEALVDIYGIKNGDNEGKHSYFLKLIDEKQGVTYARNVDETATKEAVEAAYKADVETFRNAYQDKIDAAIAALKYDNEEENGKLYAGGDKFYLPAIESISADFTFSDEYNTSRDYKYSIYYRGKTTGSSGSLEANKLAIDLNDADVTYRFTIFVTDPMGNPMRYPTVENGEFVWKEITTDDVWDEDFADLLPFFEFDVSYRKATAENPEDLSLSYVGTSYSGVSFKITGVSGTYASEYKLYVFNRSAMQTELGVNLEQEEFDKNLEALFNNTYQEGKNTRKYFTTVKAADDLLETDENYDLFKDINWNATSISFTPRSVDDFYVVELSLTDNRSQSQETYRTTVAASVQTKALKGESDWLENNKTSVILLSIAGACLVALIVLLIIKPKDKGDIDAIYTEVEEKAEKKKK